MITLHKLTEICHLLNEHDVNYVVIGGCAIFIHGYERTTQDIDLLIDADEENVGRIKKALQKILPEACRELNLDDVIKKDYIFLLGKKQYLEQKKKKT